MISQLLGFDGNDQPLWLNPEQQRAHFLCSGSSGAGKSRWLESCLRWTLDKQKGSGFALIDPEGTVYNAILDYCAHHVLDREIILLDFSEPRKIIPYNPFKRQPDTELSVQVDQCTKAILHAWNQENAEATPTLRRVLTMIFTVLIRHNLGLKQAVHLIDPDSGPIREYLIKDLQSPLIEKEWQALEALKRGERRQETLSTINRLLPLLNSEALTRFMSIPGQSLDWNSIFDRGAIVLVNLAQSGWLSEETGRMAGAMIVSDIYHAALRRPPDEFGEDPEPPFRVAIDEFQTMVGLDILKGLDRSRKRSVFWTLCHQRFGQIGDFDADIADSVLTNCRVKVVFGGLPTRTARKIAEEIFIGDLDPKKVKFAIFQTKFWPLYGRDKVYSKTTSHAVASGVMESLGYGSMISGGSGAYFQPGGDWFGIQQPSGTTALTTAGSSDIKVKGKQQSESHGVAESEADIPTIFPMPFQEVSSVQTYTIDEQLWELTAALKEQYPRHAFVKIHSEKTQPMLTPFVKRYYSKPGNREWYVDELYKKQNALTIQRADEIIAGTEDALAQKAISTTYDASDDDPFE